MVHSQDTNGNCAAFYFFFVRSTSGSTFNVNPYISSTANMTITASTSNIVLTNTFISSGTFKYSITYFPLRYT